jgi:FlaA1/EpsC-like NDP-sugar epimerase
MTSKIKVIVTGVTGMVGEGVLHECINSEAVSEILVLGRKAPGMMPVSFALEQRRLVKRKMSSLRLLIPLPCT